MGRLYRDHVFLEHETGNHPECPNRLRSIHRLLDESGILNGWDVQPAVSCPMTTLERTHDAGYIASVREFAEAGGGRIETDTVVCPRSYDVALQAAGVAVDAVDHVLTGGSEFAVCLNRPPGHHALADAAMGFCLFNNVAIAAQHALDAHRLSRVLIVDWDVHHGNGTQDIFYESPAVTFFSAHRWPFYPGTGTANETGRGAGLGTTFNLPLEFGITRKDYIERFHTMLADAAAKSRPELILVSAGFDAHAADPIGSLGLESEDFTTLTNLVRDAARQYCDGRLVSLLEGGYNVDALAESVGCHLTALSSCPADQEANHE